jgi:hypothetical protein
MSQSHDYVAISGNWPVSVPLIYLRMDMFIFSRIITDLDDLDGSALTDVSIIFYGLQIKKKQCRPIAEFPTPEALNRWDDRHLANNQVVNWSTSIACYLSFNEFLSVTSCSILH